jgi:hypothetical protein
MARQKGHIRCNYLLTVFQSGFHRHHSTAAAVLKVIEDIPLNMEAVESGGQESSVGAVTCGVPQGSVLGPLLFISYIDDVSRVIRYCRFNIYADDLQIYHTYAVSELNLELQRVHEWVVANGLKLNPIKSQVIVISRC